MSAEYVLINAERMGELRDRHQWSLWHEGTIGTIFCLIGICEGPIYFNDQVIAGFLKTTVKKWHKLRDDLIGFGIFYLTEDGHVYLRDEGKLFKFPSKGRASLPSEVKATAQRRTQGCCAYCGTLEGPFHHDHLLPLSRGGSDHANNIVLACRHCNTSKGNKTLIEWTAFLRSREAAQ